MNQIKNIDAKTLHQWLEDGEAIVIDVRETEEFQSGHIKNAVHIPLALIKYEDISLAEYAGKKIVMQCRSGVRSILAGQKVSENQQKLQLYNLEGGILAWQEAGFFIQK